MLGADLVQFGADWIAQHGIIRQNGRQLHIFLDLMDVITQQSTTWTCPDQTSNP